MVNGCRELNPTVFLIKKIDVTNYFFRADVWASNRLLVHKMRLCHTLQTKYKMNFRLFFLFYFAVLLASPTRGVRAMPRLGLNH